MSTKTKTNITRKIVARLSIAALLALLFIYIDKPYSNISPSTIQENLGISDDYSVSTISETTQLLPGDNPIRITLQNHPSQSKVTFYYQCPHGCSELWLKLPTSSGKPPLELLIEHPVFEKYPMNHVTDHVYSLYQPLTTHISIKNFLANIPDNIIYADPMLIGTVLPDISTIRSLKHALPQTKPTIFTTYIKPRLFGDWFEFTRFYQPPHNHQLGTPIIATISAYFQSNQQTPVFIKVPH